MVDSLIATLNPRVVVRTGRVTIGSDTWGLFAHKEARLRARYGRKFTEKEKQNELIICALLSTLFDRALEACGDVRSNFTVTSTIRAGGGRSKHLVANGGIAVDIQHKSRSLRKTEMFCRGLIASCAKYDVPYNQVLLEGTKSFGCKLPPNRGAVLHVDIGFWEKPKYQYSFDCDKCGLGGSVYYGAASALKGMEKRIGSSGGYKFLDDPYDISTWSLSNLGQWFSSFTPRWGDSNGKLKGLNDEARRWVNATFEEYMRQGVHKLLKISRDDIVDLLKLEGGINGKGDFVHIKRGGSGGHYAGPFQMGKAAIATGKEISARNVTREMVNDATRISVIPVVVRFWHKTLKAMERNGALKIARNRSAMSGAILYLAHNQGAGGARNALVNFDLFKQTKNWRGQSKQAKSYLMNVLGRVAV